MTPEERALRMVRDRYRYWMRWGDRRDRELAQHVAYLLSGRYGPALHIRWECAACAARLVA